MFMRTGSKGVRATLAIIIIFLAVAIVAGRFRASRLQGSMTACLCNLKNIGIACEMYSSDHEGRYPPSLARLPPSYLRDLPVCPPAGRDTYTSGYVSYFEEASGDTRAVNAFTVACSGDHAALGQPANYPQYSSSGGLIVK